MGFLATEDTEVTEKCFSECSVTSVANLPTFVPSFENTGPEGGSWVAAI